MPLCKAKFKNNSSNGVITKTFAVFYFSDGTNQADPTSGPGEVSTEPGGATYRFSSYANRDKCAVDVYMFMVWDNGSGDVYAGRLNGQCYTEVGVELVDAAIVPEGSGNGLSQAYLMNPATGAHLGELSKADSLPPEIEKILNDYISS